MNHKYKIGLLGLILITALGVSSMAFAGGGQIQSIEFSERISLNEDEDDEDFDDEDFEDEEEEDEDHHDHDEHDEDEEEHRELDGPIIRTHTIESAHSNHSMAGDHSNHAMHMVPAIHQPELASHTAVASGDWSAASTWQNGAVPAADATVAIPANIVVTVDGQITPKYKSIAIDGTLRFATDVNTELWVDTITSGMTGKLEIGTQSNPVSPDVTARIVFVDNGLIDRNVDTKQVGRGAILSGPVEIYGATKTHRITVGTFPRAGDSQLVLSSAPTGWQVGDQLIITGSQGQTSDEVRTIAAINGSTVTLNQALTLDHVPPKADLNLWVANGTRNVIFESENLEILNRGHIMFMHQLDVQIHNARFYGLGRTDKTMPLDDFEYDFLEKR